MNDTLFTEFIIIAAIVGFITAFLIVKRLRDQ
jgi:hypothetical protein